MAKFVTLYNSQMWLCWSHPSIHYPCKKNQECFKNHICVKVFSIYRSIEFCSDVCLIVGESPSSCEVQFKWSSIAHDATKFSKPLLVTSFHSLSVQKNQTCFKKPYLCQLPSMPQNSQNHCRKFTFKGKRDTVQDGG